MDHNLKKHSSFPQREIKIQKQVPAIIPKTVDKINSHLADRPLQF